jgi:hypothetical protein
MEIQLKRILLRTCAVHVKNTSQHPDYRNSWNRYFTQSFNFIRVIDSCLGKTSTAELVADQSGFNHINVSQYVKERGFFSERDEEYDSLVIDEDSVLFTIL